MKTIDSVESLRDFQMFARFFLAQKIPPTDINWGDSERMIFDEVLSLSEIPKTKAVPVPREFGALAKSLVMLRGEYKWNLLYKILYRLIFEDRKLLKLPSDKDIREADIFKKSIARDIHKMHAFVRFKRAPTKEEHYVAWHKPEHLILRAGVPFFVKRFGDKPWSILTPDESAHWNGKELEFTDGVAFEDFHIKDDWDEVWKDYYRSIYNPARLNIKMMKQEMSPKYWQSMPEAEMIKELIKNTPEMLESAKKSHWSEASVPEGISFDEINDHVHLCKACPLYKNATQAVPGVGPADARLVIVGEQPGDKEDILGKPFVGPSGIIIDSVLSELGISRDEIYFTNTVKHFSFTSTPEGGRIHKRPTGQQVHTCKPWLEAELKEIRPKVILALGVTAATALLGRKPNISLERGKVFSTKFSTQTIITWHPASILRADQDASKKKRIEFLKDFAKANELSN